MSTAGVPDLNTAIANAAVTFRSRREQCEADARVYQAQAADLAGAESSNRMEDRRVALARAEDMTEQARGWAAVESCCATGFLLRISGSLRIRPETVFPDLYQAAEAVGRVKRSKTDDAFNDYAARYTLPIGR
jgi:hypothetical protein